MFLMFGSIWPHSHLTQNEPSVGSEPPKWYSPLLSIFRYCCILWLYLFSKSSLATLFLSERNRWMEQRLCHMINGQWQIQDLPEVAEPTTKCVGANVLFWSISPKTAWKKMDGCASLAHTLRSANRNTTRLRQRFRSSFHFGKNLWTEQIKYNPFFCATYNF